MWKHSTKPSSVERSRVRSRVRSRAVYYSNQSNFGGGTAIELSENNFESSFPGADNEQAVDNFKLSWNTTALSQSNCRSFSCSGMIPVIKEKYLFIWIFSPPPSTETRKDDLRTANNTITYVRKSTLKYLFTSAVFNFQNLAWQTSFYLTICSLFQYFSHTSFGSKNL